MDLPLLTFSELLKQSDEQLVSRVVYTNHCLSYLLGKYNSQPHLSLRPRGHSFNLPIYQYNLPENLLFRNLYLRKYIVSLLIILCTCCVSACSYRMPVIC